MRDAGDRPLNASTTQESEQASSLTIDALARQTSLPSRTIRYYVAEGLLASPVRHGRVALFDRAHVRRIELIARLQERGMNLRTIRDLLGNLAPGEEDRSLRDWIGPEAIPVGVEESAAEWTTRDAVEKIGPDGPVLLDALVSVGMVERRAGAEGDVYVIGAPRIARIAVELHRAGVPIEAFAHGEGILRGHLSALARALVGYYAGVFAGGLERPVSPDQAKRMARVLRDQSVDAVRVLFRQELDRVLGDTATTDAPVDGERGSRRN